MQLAQRPHLAARLADAGVQCNPDARLRRLAGGYKNEVLLLDAGEHRLVVKLYAANVDDNPLYPNLPEQEASVLAALGPLGLAPTLETLIPRSSGAEPILVYRYVEGLEWSGDPAPVAQLLRSVHQTPCPDVVRRVPSTPVEVIAHGDRILRRAHSTSLVTKLRPDPLAREAPPPQALVHTDCGPGNLIATPEGMRLIDWQCPGRGDPIEDLVSFMSPGTMLLYGRAPHSSRVGTQFLEAYGDTERITRFHRDRAAWHWRFAAYCAYRSDTLRARDAATSALYDEALQLELDLLADLSR